MEQKDDLNKKANELMNNASDVPLDSDNIAEDADNTKEQTYQKLVRLMKSMNTMVISNDKAEMYKKISKQFTELSDYKDAGVLSEKCLQEAKNVIQLEKKSIYEKATVKKNSAKLATEFHQAGEMFRMISGYKDADELALECQNKEEILDKKAARKTMSTFAIIVFCFAVLVIGATTAHAKYYMANTYMAINSYNSAIKLYKKLDGYKDSKERLTECRYQKGVQLMEDKDFKSAAESFNLAGDYKDSKLQKADAEKLIIKNSKVGATVTLGKYDWTILEMKDNQVFLMIKTALSGRSYNDSFTDITWENSTLRQWLNNDFLNASFSEAEKNSIILSDVLNAPNAKYGTTGGNTTKDYIYLLSIDEIPNYSDLFPAYKNNCWLRSPGNAPASAAFLSAGKKVMDYGYAVDSDEIYVRPVLWLKLQ